MGRNWALIGLTAVGALAAGWWASALRRDVPAPVMILQAPAAPAITAPVAAAPAVAPAAPRPAARRVARPAPPPPKAVEPAPEPLAAQPERSEEVRVAAAEPERPAAPPLFPTQPLPPPPPPEPRSVTIPAGTLITVRLAQPLSTERNSEGDAFTATLDQPLVVNGLVIAERGSRQMGKVSMAEAAGRVKGRAALGLELVTLNTADGQSVAVTTETFRYEAESGAGRDAAKAGVMAGIGAAIGAIAGGGKGAAIGAAAGGAAGAGTVLATRGKDARLPAETRISFRLKQPVTLTEKMN